MIEHRSPSKLSNLSGSFDDGYNSVHAATPSKTGSSVSAVDEHQHPVHPSALDDPANSQLIAKVMQLTDEQVCGLQNKSKLLASLVFGSCGDL